MLCYSYALNGQFQYQMSTRHNAQREDCSRTQQRARLIQELFLIGRAPLLVLVIWCSAGHFSIGAPLYSVTDLGTLGGPTSTAWGINNRGQIVGWSDTMDGWSHAFIWSESQMHDLGTFGGTNSHALGINDHGFVVGWAGTSNNANRAFLHDTTKMVNLGTLGGNSSGANAIDSANRIVGDSVDSAGYLGGFIYTNSTMTRLPINTVFCIPTSISDNGQIVGEYAGFGQHGFLYSQRGFTDLGVLPGASFTGPSSAYDINSAGDIVGKAESSTGQYHAFVYSGGQMVDIGTLLPPGYDLASSTAYGINNFGEIVGVSTATFTGEDHAFLFQQGTMLDLNSIVLPDTGWVLQEAHRINDRGEIIGAGRHYGASHAFVASPPRLSVFLGGNAVVVSWPAWATSYFVESTTTLFVSNSWVRLAGTPTTCNGRLCITNDLGAAPNYFRLRAL